MAERQAVVVVTAFGTTIGAIVVVLTFGLVCLATGRRCRVARVEPTMIDLPPNDVPTGEIPLIRRRAVMVAAPMIDGYTLRDWLVHHTHRDRVWEDVVVAFYGRAGADPRVAVYFVGADMARLQRHFLAALTVLTHTGLHQHTVERMAAAHRGVRTPDGLPVTGQAWDVVVATLVAVLREHGVPAGAVEPLGALLEPLRAVIVVEP